MCPPWLDLSEAILDPYLADAVSVLRRTMTVNGFGEPVITSSTTPNVLGVVTVASPTDLQRLDDQQRMQRVLSFVTKFRIQGPSPGKQSDQVVWRGDTYVVIDIGPYPQFGSGFIQALIASQDFLDQPNT